MSKAKATDRQSKPQQQAAPQAGLRCTRCECPDLRVLYTRQRIGYIERVRVCRHCGKRIRTTERT